jgi:hypothetical protein
VSLGTTSANLIHITSEGNSTPVTTTQADLITSARLVVETRAPASKTLQQSAGAANSLSITGSAGGTTYFTALVVNRTIYFQLDLKDLLADTGQPPQTYSSIVSQTAGLPTFIQAFIAGKFVSLPFDTLSGFTSFLEGVAQGASKGKIPSPSQLRSVANQVRTAIASDLTVTRTSAGATDQLVVTGNAQNIGSDILSTLANAIPSIASSVRPSAAASIPSQDLTVDAAVTGGAVCRLAFDFGPVSPHQRDTLPIVASFARSGPPITAPSGATPLNLQELFGLFVTANGSTSAPGHAIPVPVPTTVTSTAAPSR